jgi:hypothetical protein
VVFVATISASITGGRTPFAILDIDYNRKRRVEMCHSRLKNFTRSVAQIERAQAPERTLAVHLTEKTRVPFCTSPRSITDSSTTYCARFSPGMHSFPKFSPTEFHHTTRKTSTARHSRNDCRHCRRGGVALHGDVVVVVVCTTRNHDFD